MKKMTLMLLAALLCFAAVLSGCGQDSKKSRSYAETYIKELANETGDALTIKQESHASRTSDWLYTVESGTYKNTFTVSVSYASGNTQDAPKICDDYYILTVQEGAQKEVDQLFREVTGNDELGTRVSIHKYYLADTSKNPAKTLSELYASNLSLQFLDIYTVNPTSQNILSEEQADELLKALLNKGWYATFYPYISDSVWFEITPNGVWKTVRSGADNGKFLERTEYELK